MRAAVLIRGATVQLSLPGLAVFVNPGPDTLVIPELSVSAATRTSAFCD